jgi:CubicO group peptidase (beta-lactamase class C family)
VAVAGWRTLGPRGALLPAGAPGAPLGAELEAAVRAYRRRVPETPVASTPVRYSNFGMGLLGSALAGHLGGSFEDAVAAEISQPLGLGETGVTLTAEQRMQFAAGDTALGLPTPHWVMPGLEGAGNRHLVLWHNGATYGSRSFIAIVPSLRIAVVALTKRGPGLVDRLLSGRSLDQLALRVLRAAIVATTRDR